MTNYDKFTIQSLGEYLEKKKYFNQGGQILNKGVAAEGWFLIIKIQ